MNGKFIWIIDNGHGIDTPGKRSPELPDGRQLLEYRFNRDVVDYMELLLESMNIPHHRLVTEENDIALGERVRRANALESVHPKVLVSVHANAYGGGSRFTTPRGIETYYYDTSYAGERLASMFQENLVQVTGWRNRGIRPGRYFIIRYVDMPAVLTESGFYTNREQLEYLLDPDWRVRIAEAHVEAMGPAFFQNYGGQIA